MRHPRDPHLLPVHHVAVAPPHRHGRDPGRVACPPRARSPPIACSRSSPRAILRQPPAFCAAEPCRSSVPILYIWPWQAPALPPARLISSMITDASARPSPEPPILLRDQRRQPPGLGQRRDERVGIAARLVDLRGSTRPGNRAHKARTASRSSWNAVWLVEHDRSSGQGARRWSIPLSLAKPCLARTCLQAAPEIGST